MADRIESDGGVVPNFVYSKWNIEAIANGAAVGRVDYHFVLRTLGQHAVFFVLYHRQIPNPDGD